MVALLTACQGSTSDQLANISIESPNDQSNQLVFKTAERSANNNTLLVTMVNEGETTKCQIELAAELLDDGQSQIANKNFTPLTSLYHRDGEILKSCLAPGETGYLLAFMGSRLASLTTIRITEVSQTEVIDPVDKVFSQTITSGEISLAANIDTPSHTPVILKFSQQNGSFQGFDYLLSEKNSFDLGEKAFYSYESSSDQEVLKVVF